MFTTKLFTLCAFTTFMAATHADEYQTSSDNYDEGSYEETNDGSSYYEESSEGSSYYEAFNEYGDGSQYSALPAYMYKFDPEYAAGVSGRIEVQYAGPFSTLAMITAQLDFSDVDMDEITAFDGNCTEEVTEYKWHIHVKWPNDYDSESFAQCGLAITGNHYDPLKACGPNSEFVGTEDCLLKTPTYDCNPEDYKLDPLVCEKGDLASKLGDFKLDEYKQVSGQWYDPNYPLPEENTPEWSIILHAVCGDVTPRIACAVGKSVY